MGAALEELRGLCRALEDQGQTDHWKLDFSLVNSMDYYNGVIFQGFLQNIPFPVLSGGRYDNLPRKMGKQVELSVLPCTWGVWSLLRPGETV